MFRALFVVAVGLVLGASPCFSEAVAVQSPDGRLEVTVAVSDAAASLAVTLDARPLLSQIELGLVPTEGKPLGPGMKVVRHETQTFDEAWTPVWGTESPVRDHYNLLTVELADPQDANRRLAVLVRAYDDGIAFRYYVPGSGETCKLSGEATSFSLPADAKAFAMVTKKLAGAYEAPYTVRSIADLGPQAIGLPLTVELPTKRWIAITEAHLHDYPGMYLMPDKDKPGRLTTRFPKGSDSPPIVRAAPFESPWRVILVGRKPGDLIESNIVINCNPPCAIDDTSWIKPGKVIWHWWSKNMVNGVNFEGGVNTETMKHYADFAAEIGLEYLLIDEGWSWWASIKGDDGKTRRATDITRCVPAIDVEEIVKHCDALGIKVWLWLTWGHCANQMAEAFPLYEKWGIAGVKVDFMNRDDQWMVNWYHEVAELAAKYHLMVDMHGAYKNAGIRRTWPNMLTREGLMGLEHSKWSNRVTPEHNVTLPFTRMLAGPMDYTPGGFNVTTRERFKHRDAAPFVMGTRCHQLAQYVVFESPLQMCVDYPEAYRGQPGLAFLEWVPTTWDRSVVIDGYPGQFIVMARRHEGIWYLGAMAGNDARTVEVPLSFLVDGQWRLDGFADGPRAAEVPAQVTPLDKTVSKSDVLTVKMAPGGGLAGRLTKKPN